MLSNAKRNNSYLSRSDLESRLVHFRSIHAFLPSYPCKEAFADMDVHCYIPEPLHCLGTKDHLNKHFLKSLFLS